MIGTRQRLSSPRKHPNTIRSRLENVESNSDEEKEGQGKNCWWIEDMLFSGIVIDKLN